MSYDLFIGDKLFSSWSLRGWLMFKKFDIPFNEIMVGLYTGTMAQDMAPLAPARLVPALRAPDGTVIGESLAMAETLAEAFPDRGLWPAGAAARATARWLAAEMHAGFGNLRNDCPMQLACQIGDFTPSDKVHADLDRIEDLFEHAAGYSDGTGPWLFGKVSLADAFFAPVAARVAGYDLPAGPRLAAFTKTVLADPDFRAWRAEGVKMTYDPFPYDLGSAQRDWPS